MENKEIFSDEDIEYVCELLKEHLSTLQTNADYLERQEKVVQFQEYIFSLCNAEIKEYFREYETALFENIEIQNCLAYHLGLQKGIQLKNI